MTARPLGLLLLVLSASIAACGALGFLADPALGWDPEETAADFEHMLRSAAIPAIAAIPLLLASWRVPVHLGRREALFVVSTIWIAMGLFGSIPFVVGADMPMADALFEAFSGLTTTGATILTDIEGRLSAPLHMWRMATHWLGGLGIVVLFVALMPGWGVGGKRLFQSEAAGPQTGGISPRIRDTAKTLLLIYCSITAALIGALWAADMPLFDAVTHSFSTIATGGFSLKNGSVGEYNNLAIELTILVGMLLAGTNFALFHRFKSGGRGVFWSNPEFRVYILLVAGATLLISTDMILNATHEIGDALRYSSFQVVAIMTGTGFGTADYEEWSTLSRSLLLMLYFCGGMAGSTTGSMKLIRIMIIVKVVMHEIRIGFRPTLVAPIRLGGSPVADSVVRGILAYSLIFVATVVIGAMMVAALDPVDLTTALMASLACVANVGPGLGAVGPTENYGFLSDGAKLVLSFCMLLGRLEFFSLLSLFVPSFWRR
ncbi:MAG: TrkH family potassium uptake protein [Myxococcota bacterium]|nr:TrkH family potassium uptake protein [Myxococcota bacterium]